MTRFAPRTTTRRETTASSTHTLAPSRRFLAIVTAAGLALVLLAGRPTHATEISVTSTSGARGGPGCTLRDAVTAANTDVATGGCPAGNGADTIILTAGATYTLTEVDNTTVPSGIEEPNGLPSVTTDITIIGNGATIARSNADGTVAFRLLHVASGGHLTINDATLTNGMPATQPGPGGNGGGILNEGVLTLINVAVIANSAGYAPLTWTVGQAPVPGCAGRGGGVFNAGTLTVNGGSVSFNHAGSATSYEGMNETCPGAGGGIYNDVAGTVALNGTTVDDNAAGNAIDLPAADGGGIFNAGNLVITNSRLTGNGAGYSDEDRGGNGGGIANIAGGTVTLVNSTVNGNEAGSGDAGSGDGGGIFNAGILTLTRCAVTNNASGCGEGCGNGGGVANDAGGTLTLIDSTVSGNRVGDDFFFGQGGGIFNNGTLRLASCTIAGNSVGGSCDYCDYGKGGGIASAGPLATVSDTLIAGNLTNGAPSDCSGALTSQGYNLIQDASNCTISGDTTGNIIGVDPYLGPLQSNGGLTETQALLPGSPAIDAGDPNGCTDPDGNVLTTDQRGAPRAVADNGRCDIGAFEASWPAWPTITMTPTLTPTTTPHTPTATVTPPPTLTPTVTPTWAIGVDINTGVGIGITAGRPGQQVTIGVFLRSRNQNVAGVQNDIIFDPSTPITETSDGEPACAVNPAIHKDALFTFYGCSSLWPHSCSRIRAIVFSPNDVSPIPDGSLLYTCNVTIALGATPGTYPLTNAAVIASDAAGHRLPAVGGADGSIVVLRPPRTATATASPTPTGIASSPSTPTPQISPALSGAPAAAAAPCAPAGSGGCSLAPGQDHGGGWWLALLLGAGFLARRGRSSSAPERS